MKKNIFATNNDWTGLIIRLTLGLILFPHGAQKMLGWFGGPGFAGEMGFFTGTLHLPWIIAFAVIFIEFFGAIALIVGFASRLWSVAIIGLFIGIIFVAHVENGFFMNWFGTQKGEGYEYHLLFIGLAIAVILNGSGKYAVDNIIWKRPVVNNSTLALVSLMLLLGTACGTATAPAVATTGTDVEAHNKQLVERYFNDVWNKGNVDLLDSLLSPDYINHTPSTPNPPKGAVGLKPIVNAIRKGFPDLHYEIRDMVVTSNRVVARVIMTGTQTDTLFGTPPTGKSVSVNQINIEEIVDGKIAEHWRVTDELTMMKQLGVIK